MGHSPYLVVSVNYVSVPNFEEQALVVGTNQSRQVDKAVGPA